MESLADYQRLSKTTWYSLVFITPLVVIYELLAVAINWGVPVELRNGADVLLRLLFEVFGLGATYVSAALLPLCLVLAWWWRKYFERDTGVNSNYLFVMAAESLVWALMLLIMLTAVDELLIISTADTALQTAFLAVGAGIYEETVFRLGLVSGLTLFLHRVMDWQRYLAVGGAIVGAAILFSGFHYIGILGKNFDWNSFAYRGVAGIMLGLLFVSRGLGITVYAHTIYDLVVLWARTVS
ncbi:MAG: CPBP family intramembrane metalloprotease [Candidatus Marinimicrobia bacterium]|nr:CPBP family intramembrane metalloprotease [Candidatus Neomarinimicrobiota bacterium]